MTNTMQSAVYIVLDRPTASRLFATINNQGALDKNELETVNRAFAQALATALSQSR